MDASVDYGTGPDGLSGAGDEEADGPLDRTALESIELLQRPGQPNLVRAVLELYASSTPADVFAIGAAATANDRTSLGRLLHKLKGCSRTVGAVRVAQRVALLEALADGGATEEICLGFEALRVAHEEALGSMHRMIAGSAPESGPDACGRSLHARST